MTESAVASKGEEMSLMRIIRKSSLLTLAKTGLMVFAQGTACLCLISCGSKIPDPKQQLSRFQSILKEKQSLGAELTMVVLGDSLGAATFAGTSMGQKLKWDDIRRVLQAISLQYLMPVTDERFLARVKKITGYEDYNAFSGGQEWSHRSRIQATLGIEVGQKNYAIPGSRTEHLAAQVRSLKSDFQNSAQAPAYVAISVGGNDFCDSYPVENAVEKLYQSIRKIREVVPQALILISGIPDIVTVYLDYDRTAFTIGGYEMTCKKRAALFPMCARETAMIGGDQAAIAQAKQDLIRYQTAFSGLVKRLESEFPNEGPVRYKGLPRLMPDELLVAADCFHPGIAGHQKIAETTWFEVQDSFNL